jgi:hypothetical protein
VVFRLLRSNESQFSALTIWVGVDLLVCERTYEGKRVPVTSLFQLATSNWARSVPLFTEMRSG